MTTSLYPSPHSPSVTHFHPTRASTTFSEDMIAEDVQEHLWFARHDRKLMCARCFIVPDSQSALRKALGFPSHGVIYRHIPDEWKQQVQELAEQLGYSYRQYKLILQYGETCYWCRRKFTSERPPTLEHLVPRSRTLFRRHNLTAACFRCNHDKGDMTPEEYRWFLAQGRSPRKKLLATIRHHRETNTPLP